MILKDGLDIIDRDSHVFELKDQIVAANASLENEVVHLYNIGSLMGFSAKLNKLYVFSHSYLFNINSQFLFLHYIALCRMLQQQLAHPNVKYIEADQIMSINYKKEPRSTLATVTQKDATWVM